MKTVKSSFLFAISLLAVGFLVLDGIHESNAQTPTLQWVYGFGSSSYDEGNSMITDASGNVYTTGNFGGTIDFDPGVGSFPLSASAGSLYISKLDAFGNFIWAKQLSGTPNSITLDVSGNVYLTGDFGGTKDFDPGVGIFNLTSIGSVDIFICKLNNTGDFVWAGGFGGSGPKHGSSIKVDVLGNVYTAGYFYGTCDFDPGSGVSNLNSSGLGDVFICKLDSSGNFVWARRFGGGSGDYCEAIDLDNSGNIYSTGSFTGTVDFDPSVGIFNLIPIGTSAAYISKLDSSGNFIFAEQLTVGINFIDIDLTGNILLTGSFSGTNDFDPGAGSFNLTAAVGGSDIFICKLDANGNFVFAKQINLGQYDSGSLIITDSSGNIYSTGFSGSSDAFINKMDSLGNIIFTFIIPVSVDLPFAEKHLSMAIDPLGNIYSTGRFFGTTDFDPSATSQYTLTAQGTFADLFIAKYSPPLIIPTNTNWSSITRGSGIGGQPNCMQNIIIDGNAILTVDVPNAECKLLNINLNSDGTASQLKFNSGSVLTTCDNVVVGASSGSGRNGIVDMSLGGTLRLGRAFTLTSGRSTFNSGLGTVEYYASTSQTIAGATYNELKTSGSSTKSATSALTVNGSLVIGVGTTFSTGGSLTHLIAGDLTNNGAFSSSSIIKFNGNGSINTQVISGSTAPAFGTLTIGSGAKVRNDVVSTASTAFNIEGNGYFIHNAAGALPGGTRTFSNTGLPSTMSTIEYQKNTVNTSPVFADYGNLIINISNYSAAVNAGGNLRSVAGDFILKNTSGQTLSMVSNQTTAHNIGGNLSIEGANAFLAINTASSGSGTPIVSISGDLSISDGNFDLGSSTGTPTINISGNVILSGGILRRSNSSVVNINVSGDWTNNGGNFMQANTTVNFNNLVNNQSINGTASTQVFNNLKITKSNQHLIIGGNTAKVTIGSTLTMTSGNIDCGSNTLELGTSTASTGTLTYTAGNIIGNFKRWFNSTGAKPFPLGINTSTGTSSAQRNALITFSNLTNGSLTGKFIASDPGSAGLPLTENSFNIYNQFTEGFWSFVAADALASTNYSIELTGSGFISNTINTNTRIIKRTNGSANWALNGTHVAAVGSIAKRSALGGFSEFALAAANNAAVLNLKAFIQGFYSGAGLMNNMGAGGNLFVTGISANPSSADSVFISAMDPVTHAEVERKSAIMNVNGNTTINFSPAVISGNSYYIKVNHRNSLETWSASPVLMSAITNYDFTTAQNKAYGNNMVDVGTPILESAKWAFYSGDCSDATLGSGFQDGIIESQDYSDMENAVSAVLQGYEPEDITGDGVVESLDYSIMENNVYYVFFSVHP